MKGISNRPLSDMETDGVYFPSDIKKELQKRMEELTCEYSGLPSILSYMELELDKEDEEKLK